MKLKDPDKIHLIYKATLKLVMAHGLPALNMAAIGKEAKLGMGTIYVYFKSKEELINSLFKHLKKQNTERIYAGIKEHAPFKVNMKQLFDDYIKNRMAFFEEHFFIDQAVNSHYLDQASKKLDEAAFVGLFGLLNQGKKELLLKQMDNEILTAHLLGSANELVNLMIKNHKKINKPFLNQAFSLSWDSISL